MNKELKAVVGAGVFFLLLIAGAVYVVMDLGDQLELVQGENAQLVAKIDGLKKEVAQRESLQLQLDKLEAGLAQYVRILPLPEVANEEWLMNLVQDKLEQAQFRLMRIEVTDPKGQAGPPPRGKGAGPAFREVVVRMTAQGTYDQFLRFLNLLEKHETFVRINKFACDAGQQILDDDGKVIVPLSITMDVSTYRYTGGGK